MFFLDPTEMLRDIMISEAFVHMSVEMIGHYENHFIEINGNMAFQVILSLAVISLIFFYHCKNFYW